MTQSFSKRVIRQNQEFYGDYVDQYCLATQSLNMEVLHARFASYLPRHAKILDAGCGSGRDSVAFQRLGFDVTAIDSSRDMVSVARRCGIRSEILAFQELNYHRIFDGIWASASLLHVPHDEIDDVLCRLRAALKPNGIAFISLKRGFGERVESDGRFFSYFTAGDFCQRAIRAGFDVVETVQSSPSVAAGPSWLQYILRRPPAVTNRKARSCHISIAA
jgi:SAM-dependent methyltransferase